MGSEMQSTDAEEEEESRSPPPYNPRIQTSIWVHPDVIIMKVLIALFAFLIFWLIFSVTWMWVYQAVPSVPPDILSLGGVYYIPFYIIVIINLAMSLSRSAKLFRWVWFLDLFAFLLSVWMACIGLYQLITCWDQTQPEQCRVTLFNQYLLIWLTIILWVLMSLKFLCFTSMLMRVRNVKT